jgi:hypothetical protein
VIRTPLADGWTLSLLDGPAPEHVRTARVAATVPGSVHTDLLAAGLIDDPYLDDNEALLAWIGRCDWRYETGFEWAPRVSTGSTGSPHGAAELVLEGLDTVATVRLNGNSKAVCDGDADGFVRIVCEPGGGRVLGASLIGPHVTELVHELALAAHRGLTLTDIADTIHAHPTLSEAVGEAALAGVGRGAHSL